MGDERYDDLVCSPLSNQWVLQQIDRFGLVFAQNVLDADPEITFLFEFLHFVLLYQRSNAFLPFLLRRDRVQRQILTLMDVIELLPSWQ